MIDAKQQQWLRTASDKDVLLFISRGEPDAVSVYNSATGDFGWRPSSRGMTLKTPASIEVAHDGVLETQEEAQKLASVILLHLSEQARSIEVARIESGHGPLDELALGIDGSNSRIAESCEDACLNIVTMNHLGALAGSGSESCDGDLFDRLVETIRDMAHHERHEPLADALPFIREIAAEAKSEDWRDMEIVETFMEAAIEGGHLGFLAVMATPIKEYSESGKSASFSWGRSTSTVVYGHSFEEMVDSGKQWAANFDAQCKARAVEKPATAEIQPG